MRRVNRQARIAHARGSSSRWETLGGGVAVLVQIHSSIAASPLRTQGPSLRCRGGCGGTSAYHPEPSSSTPQLVWAETDERGGESARAHCRFLCASYWPSTVSNSVDVPNTRHCHWMRVHGASGGGASPNSWARTAWDLRARVAPLVDGERTEEEKGGNASGKEEFFPFCFSIFCYP